MLEGPTIPIALRLAQDLWKSEQRGTLGSEDKRVEEIAIVLKFSHL